ncbi:PAS domain-containing protein [Natronolimnobius sp. AArcel1]|uniref:PAS domain-containing protein n=1 Tax=Natronolimnobius sp. AArcel1 TaxID=1679093 RepID=UPI0013EDE09D|nr:PAS domain-containing protein [Natronolimnobius sp. AArcel1]NGM68255.1 PAS domain-containing protein [Natronolimnobius sp. AArcel1]
MVRSSIHILLFAPTVLGEAIATRLRRTNTQFVVVIEHDEAAVLERLQESHTIDCLLGTDETLLACGGEDVRPVVEAAAQIPTVLLTRTNGSDAVETALEAGVADSLHWDGAPDDDDAVDAASSIHFDVLSSRIQGALTQHRNAATPTQYRTILSPHAPGSIYRDSVPDTPQADGGQNVRQDTLIDNLPGVVYRCRNDSAWPMEVVEGTCEEITGYTGAQLESGEVVVGEDLIHPADRESAWDDVQTALESGEPYEVSYRIETKTGATKWIWERGQGIYAEDGSLEALEGFFTDVTERRGRQLRLRRNQRRFEAVFEDPEMLVGLLELDGTLLQANQAALKYVNVTHEEVVDTPFWETPWWSDDMQARVKEWVERAAGGEYVEYVVDNPIGNGETRRVSGTIRPVTDDSGAPTSMVVSARDVTDQRDHNRDLQETRDKLEILNQVVRHDLRNDMQVVRGRARLLEDHVDSEGAYHLNEIHGSASDAIELTETARSLTEAMLGRGNNQQLVSIKQVVTSAVETVRSRYDSAAITVYGLATAPHVLANDMLESVIRNLLENAVVHNDSDLPDVEVSINHDSETVMISVADNGPGIPDARKDDVFGRGEKGLESPGTGLGLHLVQTLVDQFDGEIEIQDNHPTGSIFRIELPVVSTTPSVETET